MFSQARGSQQRCSIKIRVNKIVSKFTGKHLCQSLFYNKVSGPRAANILKKELWHKCFPVNFFQKFSEHFFHRTPPKYCFYQVNSDAMEHGYFTCLLPLHKISFGYSWVSNRREGLNKRGGWLISAKMTGRLAKISKVNKRGGWNKRAGWQKHNN